MKPPVSLFRNVPGSITYRDIGVPIGVTSLWSRSYGLLLSLLLIAVGSLVCFGTYSRRTEVTGFLVPDKGLIKVISPRPGHIVKEMVTEGQYVQTGEPLLMVDVSESSTAGRTADLIAENLQSRRQVIVDQLNELQTIQLGDKQALDATIDSVAGQITSLRNQITAEEKYAEVAERLFTRSEELQERSANSASTRDQAEENLADARSKVAALQVSLSSLEGNLAQYQNQKASLSAKQASDRSVIQQTLSELDQQIVQNDDQRTLILKAPQSGIVTRLTVRPGSSVDITTPVLTVIPDDGVLEANLYVPSSAAGFLSIGQAVELQYDAYPFEKFGLQHAVVSSISRTSVAPTELPFLVTSQEPMYLITARLQKATITAYGREEPLVAGAKLQAELILESRRIWQWIFEPLIAAKANL